MEQQQSRLIHLDPNETIKNHEQKFKSNKIRTSKYTILTFLPLNLFEQFHRLANVYFLILVILNWIPQLQVFGKEISMFPIIIVLCATAIKDMYEDYTRYRSDKEVNHRSCSKWVDGKVVETRWSKVVVGDIIKIEMEKQIPADIVVLSTSSPEQSCYVSTMNLDGETNLKVRKAAFIQGFSVPHVAGHTMWDPAFKTLVCELPHENIYKFTGYITRKSEDGSDLEPIPLDNENILLRGCVLRNTEWALGVVVYTGHETKSMLNSKRAPSKRCRLEKDMNKMVLWLIALLLTICLIVGVGTTIWEQNNTPELIATILGEQSYDIHLRGFFNFLSSIIVFQVMIPIAVYITIDIVNLIQVFFINADLELYDEKTDTPMNCRALNIHEDLGQISYIFSDKTGTLTCNRQTFNQCSIDGERYSAPDLDDLPYPKVDSIIRELEKVPHVKRHFFMLTLAICNGAMIDVLHFDKDSNIPKYQSESPDEISLVNAAAQCGYILRRRNMDSVTVEIFGVEQVFKVLAVLPFNSDRKRMSVMIRSLDDGQVFLLTKGADEVIYSRLAPLSEDDSILKETRDHLNSFSVKGLRTLCLAYRTCSEDEYQQWMITFNEASGNLERRETIMNELYDTFENGFTLLGATAVEDKLQDLVPETISALYQAGINIWVLTGDMQNTAINVAYSCNLLNETMTQYIISSDQEEECTLDLKSATQKLNDNPTQIAALVIHGKSLVHVLKKEHEKQFFDFVSKCKIVICCRVSPLQKALVVNLVRKFTDHMTLAIGDGANDVGMIQAAHVGVGINGQEGRQAVMSSDFAISQFHFLRDLMLVHGHWAYYRLSYFIIYFLYKNALFVMILFWYQIYCAYSNQTPIDDVDLILFGLIYTNLPIICYAIFDKDIERQVLINNPWLYEIGQNGVLFNQKIFLLNLLDLFWQSVIITFFPIYIYWAISPSLYSLGVPIVSSCIIVVAFQLCLETFNWTGIHHFCYWLSLFIFFPISEIFDLTPESLNYNRMGEALGDPLFYLTCLLVVVLSLTPRYTIRAFNQMFYPDLVTQAREHYIVRKTKRGSRVATETMELTESQKGPLDSNQA